MAYLVSSWQTPTTGWAWEWRDTAEEATSLAQDLAAQGRDNITIWRGLEGVECLLDREQDLAA